MRMVFHSRPIAYDARPRCARTIVAMSRFPDEPFTRADLEALGLTLRALRTAIDDHEVRRVVHGVYVAGDAADTIELRVDALSRVVAADQVVCDRTAAWLHGVPILTSPERDFVPPVEVCALRWHARSRRFGVRGRTRDLIARDLLGIGSMWVTTPLRTALDLGCNLHRRDAMAALDQFGRGHGLTQAELAAETGRFRGRRGVIQLRQLIPLMDPRAESVRESWTRLAMRDAGLPTPVPQFWVEIDSVPTYRLDLAYPHHCVAIEYDGHDFHDLTAEQRHRDEERRDWLRRNGWTVIVVRNGDFTGARLDRWLSDVRTALASRPLNLRW